MLSLYKLEIFASVVQAGSFSKAANRLYLTQSAISQHIQDLETQLGTQLFKRGPRGVTLTSSGEMLLNYTNAILHLVKEAENVLTNVEMLVSGQLRIGATPGADVYLLPDWIGAFQHRFPRLTISLTTNVTAQIIVDIQNHILDLGFVEGELDDGFQLGQVVLKEVEQVVIVGRDHAWYNKSKIPLEALADQPFIMRPSHSHTRQWIENILKQRQIPFRVIAEFDNPEAIKRAVSAGMGITIFPEYIVQHEMALGLLCSLTVQDALLHRTIKLIWNNTEPISPIARAFSGYLAGQFPQLHGQLVEEGR